MRLCRSPQGWLSVYPEQAEKIAAAQKPLAELEKKIQRKSGT